MRLFRPLLLVAGVSLVGCATPTPGGGTAVDEAPAVVDTAEGFTLAIKYSRYQFIPESSAVQAACRQELTATAHDIAAQRGRRIEAIDEQRIRISMGRNGFTGITSCEASAPAIWRR